MASDPEPGDVVDRLLALMARLRDPEGGCPWDVEQRFETIAPYTIEEAYEVDDAIRRGDMEALREELGDLLLQVVFHARMAQEAGAFHFAEVAEALCEKLVRRHPHVFGDERIASAGAQTAAWEEHKARERAAQADARGEPPSALDGLPLGLPALLRAQKLLRRAVRAGLAPAPDAGRAADDVVRRAEALRATAPGDAADARTAVGALLASAAALAAAHGVDAEEALRDATARRERALREREA